MKKKEKRINTLLSTFVTVLATVAISIGANQYFPDIIVAPIDGNGIWIDTRAYATLSEALAKAGVNDREIYILREEPVTTATIDSNITLKFRGDGAINNSGQLTINTRNIDSDDRTRFTGAGDVDFAVGSVVRSSWFSGLYNAITLTNDDWLTLVISEQANITANCAVGNQVTLKWESSRNRIIANSGFTLSNIKNIQAGPYQLFAGAGDFDFLDGTELKLSWFYRLRSALTWIESEEVTIIVDKSEDLDYSDTADSNENLKIIPGNILDAVAGTETLSINGGLIADPSQQIFGSNLTATFGTGRIVYPEWWGIDGTNDEVQFQAANDSLPADGGTVELAADTTYVLSTVGTIQLSGLKYYCVQPKSNVNWVGNGYSTVVKLADSQTAGGNDPWIFATNTAYENVIFKNFRFEMNSANNDIASNKNVTSIGVSGNSAYAKNIKIDKMWFEDNPGLNFIVLGQSNDSGATLGDDIVVSNSKFYQTAVDVNATDHTSVYTWANNVRITNCFFENESTNTNGWRYSTAWEFHGSNCIAVGNHVKRFARGCYLSMNYVANSVHQEVIGNTFDLIGSAATFIFREDGGGGAYVGLGLDKIIVSNNTINLYDRNIGALYGLRADVGKSVGEITFSDNIVYGTDDGGAGPPVSKTAYGVLLIPDASATIESAKISDNLFRDLSQGVSLSTLNASMKSLTIQNNTFRDMATSGGVTAMGIQLAGANGIDHLKVSNNMFTDDGGNTMEYGMFLNGTVTKFDRSGNTFNNMQTTEIHEGGSFSPTEYMVDGERLYSVQAAATGGTDTFIVTVTLDTDPSTFLMQMDVTGYFGVSEVIGKRWASSGRLAADAMADGESAEVFTIGDALKAQLTAGNPTAVGSGNQFTITFTNADNSAFNGYLHIGPERTFPDSGNIITITAANNQ